jgi:deoxycytidine triphosphate deaminase
MKYFLVNQKTQSFSSYDDKEKMDKAEANLRNLFKKFDSTYETYSIDLKIIDGKVTVFDNGHDDLMNGVVIGEVEHVSVKERLLLTQQLEDKLHLQINPLGGYDFSVGENISAGKHNYIEMEP